MIRKRLVQSISAAALLAGVTAVGPADAQIIRTSVTSELARGLGAMNLVEKPKQSIRRYAIVIGNQDYDHIDDLKNANNDARAVADFLREHDFIVFDEYDLDKRRFERLLRRSLLEFDGDSEVLFYYAGHGIQIGRRNYLLPTDVTLENVHDVPFETVTLDQLLALLASRTRLQLVILDSCRENPFQDRKLAAGLDASLFETNSGFSTMSAPINTLLSFSTSPGALAFDGAEEGNSPFTDAFVTAARATPTESITRILEEVRRRVYSATGGRQVPWESSTLVEPFLFQKFVAPAALQVEAKPEPEPPAKDALAAALEKLAPAKDATTSAAPAEAAAAAPEAATASTPEAAAAAAPAAPTPEASAAPTATADAMPAAVPEAATAEAPEPETIVIAAAIDREVDVGLLIASAIDLPEGAVVEIQAQPAKGALVFDASAEDAPASTRIGSDMKALAYDISIDEQSAVSDAPIAFVDSFELAMVKDGVSRPIKVEIKNTAEACDMEAGDWLDPGGVGLARYPNEIMPEKALEACQAAVARAPEKARFHYQLGRAHLALRQFDEAEAAFMEAQRRGHVRALYALGALKAGRRISTGGAKNEREPEEVLALYAAGAEQGDAYAMHALGKQLLRYGQNDAEREEGFELLSRAIEVGHTFSMNELGYYFLAKDTDHYQPERALGYLNASAEREDIYGYNNLGLVYSRGLGGVEQDPAQALDWFTKAAVGGHPFAPVNVGRMYYQGRIEGGVDMGQAIDWYDQGLARGDGWGGANAAWIILNKRPKGFAPADAAERAAKAAALRNPAAAKNAHDLLKKIRARDLTRATQKMLNALGADVAEDGAYGPATRRAIEAAAEAAGVTPELGTAQARIVTVARAHWRQNPFRVDLY